MPDLQTPSLTPQFSDLAETLRADILTCNLCDGSKSKSANCRLEASQPTPFWPRVAPAHVMMIGRNPGINEDNEGRPFVGRGGQLFQKWLDGLEVKRGQIWLTNLVKCYTSKDRKPRQVEINNCWTAHLRREILWCQPSLIVAMGAEAFAATTGMDKLTLRHGILYDRRDILGAYVMGVIHPGSAMRDSSFLAMMRDDGKSLKPLLHWALAGKLEHALPSGYEAQ